MPLLIHAKWDKIENDVVTRIRLLKAICDKLDANDWNQKIAADLIVPSLETLADFCQRVKLDDTN